MIEWLRRVDPARRFLVAPDRVWTYGDAYFEVERKIIPGHRLVRPSLDSSSVFEILAGLSGGGLTVGGPVDRIASKPDADLVVFTSGTTGPPKGVRLTMANLEAASQASMRHLRHDETDNWILAMPLHHVGGLSIVVRQVYSGGSITLLPGFDPVTFAAAMHEDVTMVSAVPTMLRRIIHFGPFTGLRAVLVGGGPIPDGLLEEAVAAG
ncbi:MAG TPA: AMP-binding protein, partial [Acidimicrobiia bacterium]